MADPNPNTNSLSDAELKDVSGGMGTYYQSNSDKWCIYNAKGELVGKILNGKINYWKCTHCNDPVHMSSAGIFFCDVCDDWWISRAKYIWNGTAEELIAASH